MQYFIYFFLAFLGVTFVKDKKISVGLLVFIWILFAFNRDNADYSNYEYIYSVASIQPSFFFEGVEIGWRIVCTLCRDLLHLKYAGCQIVVSSFSIFLLYNTVSRYTKNIALFLALFAISPMLVSLVQIRNFLSFTIVMWGMRFLEKKTPRATVLYCLCVVLASTFHITSIFFILWAFIRYLDFSKLIKLITPWCIVGPLVVRPLGQMVIELTGKVTKYVLYSTSIYTKVGTLIYLSSLLFISYKSNQILQQSFKSPLSYKGSDNDSNYALTISDITIAICIINFIIWPFTFITTEILRIARNVSIICCIVLCISIGNEAYRRNQFFLKIFSIILSVFSLWYWGIMGKMKHLVFIPAMESNVIFQSDIGKFVVCGLLFILGLYALYEHARSEKMNKILSLFHIKSNK